MKEFIKRTVSILIIISSLLLLFLPSVLRIDNIKSSEWREFRIECVESFETTQEDLLSELEEDNSMLFKEDLKDSGLPYTASSIKRMYKKIIRMVKELANSEISFKELINVTLFVPEIVEHCESLLEFNETTSGKRVSISKKDTNELLDTMEEVNIFFVLVLVFFACIILIGLLAAVTEAIGKLRFFKYIFFIFVILISIALIVVPFLLDGVIQSAGLIAPFCEAVIRPTIVPFAVILMAFLGLIAPVFFKKRNIKNENIGVIKGEK